MDKVSQFYSILNKKGIPLLWIYSISLVTKPALKDRSNILSSSLIIYRQHFLLIGGRQIAEGNGYGRLQVLHLLAQNIAK
jgi:hypothetical protein